MDKIEPIIKNSSNNIIELLLEVNKKHYLYLKNKDLNSLESFLDGYSYAQFINKFEIQKMDVYNNFFKWLKAKYCYKGELGFFSILNEVEKDLKPKEKYDTFYSLLNQYLREINYNN
ncbi:hypothetical protein [Aquimarina sp. 2201CG14-23]|uniref:hypothetical protein n=1 Tax=Aquimarina mycalae TaxID=3040073 RepID=UPI002477DCA0|nr:hypothetical protein [Aquimarina sp. 2201CG14-23]MDH7448435.1 hypothetical protein [Aquimarina sp. 2201CG14-23]